MQFKFSSVFWGFFNHQFNIKCTVYVYLKTEFNESGDVNSNIVWGNDESAVL